jgi:aspartyl/asparaginyl beta-hydroxylase (cupin superfamily)
MDPVAAVNWRFKRHAGGEGRPAFYDIDATYPSLRILDRAYPVIRAEMEAVLQGKDRIPRYHDLDRAESYIAGSDDPEKNWRVFMLWSMAGTPKANQARCPRTTALLRRIPNLYQAFFSILDAGKSIPAHSGSYLGYLRYHLGLHVPATNPPTMRSRISTTRGRPGGASCSTTAGTTRWSTGATTSGWCSSWTCCDRCRSTSTRPTGS